MNKFQENNLELPNNLDYDHNDNELKDAIYIDKNVYYRIGIMLFTKDNNTKLPMLNLKKM